MLSRKFRYHEEYKARLLNKWACQWNRSEVHRPLIVPLFAMLLVENTALDPMVRGDQGWAIGITQWNLLHRQFDGKWFSYNIGGFLRDYHWFREDVQAQFNHYSHFVRYLVTEENKGADAIIKSWNSREVGRRAKVKRYEEYVSLSIR